MPEQHGERQRIWPWRVLVGVVHAALFTPTAFNATYGEDHFVGPNLFRAHTMFSGFVFHDWWRPATPGYLWQLSSRLATEAVRSSDLRLGAVVASALFSALFGVAIFEVYRRVTDRVAPIPLWCAAAVSIGVALLESPAALTGWSEFTSGRLFMPIYLPFAPTTLGSLGLNVLLLLAVSALFDGRLARARYWQLSALVVVTTIAKPTLVPLLVAVVVGMWITGRIRRSPGPRPGSGPVVEALNHPSWDTVVRVVAVPAVIVLVPQFLVTAFLVRYPGTGYDDRGAWVLHPFAELRELHALNLYFWLALAFPVAALLLAGRDLWRDTTIRLAAIAAIVGLVATILFERAGSTWRGDILQLPEAAIAMLMVFMPRRLGDLARMGRLGRPAVVVLSSVLAVYLVAGVTGWSCRTGLGCAAL